jgi:hypothetical protein
MAAPAQPEISYAKSRGLSIAYSEAGDGPLDLVMVPGFVSHLEGALGQPRIARPVGRLAPSRTSSSARRSSSSRGAAIR